MLGQTQPGRLYQSVVSSDSHDLQVFLRDRGQLESFLVVGAMSGYGTVQRLAWMFLSE